MSPWLIIITGLIYVYIAIEQAYRGNIPIGVMYFGYALGNAGSYLLVKSGEINVH